MISNQKSQNEEGRFDKSDSCTFKCLLDLKKKKRGRLVITNQQIKQSVVKPNFFICFSPFDKLKTNAYFIVTNI